MEKTKLKKEQAEIVDSSTERPQLHLPGVQDILEVKEESWPSIILGWFKGILLFAVFTTAVLALIYVALAGTVMFVANPSGQSLVLVARGTFTGGIAEKGSTLYISETSKAPTTFFDNLLVGFTGGEDASTVKVESTQYDLLILDDETVKVDGETIEGRFIASPANAIVSGQLRLDNTYLVSCVSGNCEKGTLYVVNQSQVFGEVKKQLN
jgi:hypothetical protein